MIMICSFRWRVCYRHQRRSDCCRCPPSLTASGYIFAYLLILLLLLYEELSGYCKNEDASSLPPFPEGSSQGSLGLCLATRLPPLREAQSFAPQPHDGFAFLAAHGCACRPPDIPTPDEFPMNSERPYIFFDLFPKLLASW